MKTLAISIPAPQQIQVTVNAFGRDSFSLSATLSPKQTHSVAKTLLEAATAPTK